METTTIPAAADEGPSPSTDVYFRYLALIPAAIVVAALYFGRPVLLPLAVAILFAFALAPLVGWLRRFGAGRVFSVLVAAAVSIAILSAIGAFVAANTIELAQDLPRYQENVVEKIRSLRGTATDSSNTVERLSSFLRELRDQVSRTPAQRRSSDPVPVQIQQPELEPLDLVAGLIGPLLGVLLSAGIIVVFVVFILLYKDDIRDRFIRLAGSQDIQRTTLLLDDGAERLGRFLLTQTAINATFGVFIAAGLWIIGVPNAALWGVGAAVLRFIPYIGVPLSAIAPVVLAISVDPGWSKVLETIPLFVVGEIITGQAIEPWLFGRRVGLSPLAVVIAAIFWTWLWGPAGLLLSTPLTMCLLVLGRHVEHLRFLDVLLGDRPPLGPEQALYIRMLSDDADQAAVDAEGFLKQNALPRYYDDVVLKALALAHSDAKRGALSPARALTVKATTEALIENLSDAETAEGDECTAPECEVLCIGGRGPLDEAAALLLIHLLKNEHVAARAMTARAASASAMHDLDTAGVKCVCLCYLEAGNFSRARYVLRRVKRRMPHAAVIAAFWGHVENGSGPPDFPGSAIVTTLDGALKAVLAVVHPASPPSADSDAAQSSPSTNDARTRTKRTPAPAAQ